MTDIIEDLTAALREIDALATRAAPPFQADWTSNHFAGLQAAYNEASAIARAALSRAEASGEGEDQIIRGLRLALLRCEEQFTDYRDQHLAKSPPDTVKAKTNEDMAIMCRNVSALAQPHHPSPSVEAAARKETLERLKALAAKFAKEPLEWDDRTSPEEYPDHMLITVDELAEGLHSFAQKALCFEWERLDALTQPTLQEGEEG